MLALGRGGQGSRICIWHIGFWPTGTDREKVLSRQTTSRWRRQREDFVTERKMSYFGGIKGQMRLSPTKWSSWNAVSQASGMAAAWIKVMSLGIGIRRPSGTVTYCAWPPPESRAITLSPTFHRPEQPGPSPATAPAASRPKISLAPLGGGYFPLLWNKNKREGKEGKAEHQWV